MAKKKKAKKAKPIKFDGLNPSDEKNLVRAIRQVWSWSYSRRLVVNRCLLPGGFSKCEKCGNTCAKVYVDHIEPVGGFSLDLIKRTFLTSKEYQGLCNECHREKTNAENRARKKKESDDFY